MALTEQESREFERIVAQLRHPRAGHRGLRRLAARSHRQLPIVLAGSVLLTLGIALHVPVLCAVAWTGLLVIIVCRGVGKAS